MRDYKKKAESFRVKAKINAIRFVDKEGVFGIYNCILAETPEKEVKLALNGTFNMKGEIPYELKEGKNYVVYLFGNPEYNAQYKNYTYTIDKFETEQLTLPEEQYEFLATVATPDICEQLEKLYPDQPIIDLIFDNKVDTSLVHGLGEKSLENLKEKLELYRDLGKLQSMLKPLGVTIRSIKKIATHFGNPDTACHVLKQSLYNLCEVKGFGFSKVDEIALKGGTEPTDELRIKYCLGYLLEQGANEGHSWNYREDLKTEALELLQIEPSYIDAFYEKSIYQKGEYYKNLDIISVGELVTTFGMYMDERNTLNQMDRILEHYVPMADDEDYLNRQIDFAQEELNIVYSPEQRDTILFALKYGVVIIEGKAGTGKTTVVKAIVHIQQSRGIKCMAVALSGKAAYVLSSKGLDAATIHRTLGYNGDGFTFNTSNPLPYGSLQFDEAGMANAGLWSAVVSAIPDKGQLIISGDSGQLAAIGHGDVMRDILGSIRFPKRELEQIHRQAEDSGVIEIAHKVRKNEPLTDFNQERNDVYGKNEDLQIITLSKPRKDDVIINPFMTEEEQKEAYNPIYVMAKRVLESKISNIKYSHDAEQQILDFQILCPTRAGALGVDSINRFVQHLYNDNTEGIKKGSILFKKDDKVIISGNKYGIIGYESISDYLNHKPISVEVEREIEFEDENDELYSAEPEVEIINVPFDLFNGTMGIIKGAYPDREQLLIQFEGVQFNGQNIYIAIHEDDLDALDLGYAITVHKSQGSSIPNVLILFDYSAFKLLSKQLIYTALTRTSTGKCMMLCENNALVKAVSTDASGFRRTFMRLFLEHLDAQQLAEEAEQQEYQEPQGFGEEKKE